MKAIEQYFHVVLFIMLYKVVVTFMSVVETLAVVSCDTVHYAAQVTIQLRALFRFRYYMMVMILFFFI